MTSALAEPNAALLRGDQHPRVLSVPEYVSSAGQEAVELAAMAGLHLDEWQRLVLEHALGERPDGTWAAFEVGVVVPRQNGKGALLEARELAGLFLLGERLIIHSAHQFDTSLEAFRRLLGLIEDTPDLERRVKRVSRAHGEEGIELRTGQRIRFRTRTKGGGRGFSGDCLILDEAMILPESAHGALLPTLSARPNPQVWYTGSAVDQDVHEHGRVLARVRKRGHAGGDQRLVYCEWSPNLDLVQVADRLDDRRLWAQANPGLGIRIAAEHVAAERPSMDPRTFAVERLGVGDWPDLEVRPSEIDLELWAGCRDPASRLLDPVVFAVDAAPARTAAAVAAAGWREDGRPGVEIVAYQTGVEWVEDRLVELSAKHHPSGVVCDRKSPAAAFLDRLATRGVQVDGLTLEDHVRACGNLYDAVQAGRLRHQGTPELDGAVRGAAKRTVGDSWLWSRRSSSVDISPLVAATLALWALETRQRPGPARAINLQEV